MRVVHALRVRGATVAIRRAGWRDQSGYVGEESLGFVFFEVLEEPLMENHVEGEIGKGKRKGISLN